MPTFRCCSILICLFGFCCAVSSAQDREPNFPTDDEVTLLLTQADRAIQQYKPLLDTEEKMLGAKGQEAVAKDHQVVDAIETAIKAFRKNPQGFNGPLGFIFFEWLDDADRNALLCASNSAVEAILSLAAGDKDRANTLTHLSNSCLGASSLMYTVSENAGALYTRYAEGEEKLAKESAGIAQKCAEILKQKAAPKQ
jgi:hypothetical protein